MEPRQQDERPVESAAPEIRPDGELMRRASRECGVSLGACYGCKKCSNGCPLSFAMDLHPYQVVRLAQLGQIGELKRARTIWICASCQTCLTRCPNQVDLPRFMDWLKQELAMEGGPVPEEKTLLFHRIFLREVASRGRVFEGSLMGRYMLATGGAFGPEAMKNARLGLAMFRRGRLKLMPSRIRDRRWLRALFAKPAHGQREARP